MEAGGHGSRERGSSKSGVHAVSSLTYRCFLCGSLFGLFGPTLVLEYLQYISQDGWPMRRRLSSAGRSCVKCWLGQVIPRGVVQLLY